MITRKLSAADYLAALFVASILVLVHALFFVKIVILALFLFAVLWRARRLEGIAHDRLIWFYLSMVIVGSAWAIVSLLNPANRPQGITDSFKLYCVWSLAFLVLYSLLRSGPSLRILHNGIVAAGILIPLVNFVQAYGFLTGSNLIPESIARELFLPNLDSEGFAAFSGANIAALFVVAPYLLAVHCRSDAGPANSKLSKLALALSLLVIPFSGRRALVLVVAFTPLAILLLSRITKTRKVIRARRLLYASTLAVIIGLCSLWLIPADYFEDVEPIAGFDIARSLRVRDAFSGDDERSLQKPYLIKAFIGSPLLGTGFGAYAGYTRSEDEPWKYELTYHQMLMNLGLVGISLVGGIFLLYFIKVISLLRKFREGSAIPAALLIGFCGLIVGSYSNPYFGGFDTLFFAGLLPFLSTFRNGFNQQTPCTSKCRSPQTPLPQPHR